MAEGKGKYWIIGLIGLLVGFFIMAAFDTTMNKTSTNEYCMSCHTH